MPLALFLWGTVLIIGAVFLGATQALPSIAGGWEKLLKGFGVALLIYGALLIIGSASGSHSVWQPLQGVSTVSTSSGHSNNGVKFTQIQNLADLEQQIALSNKPLMLDLYADWCVECKTMEMTTFQDPTVVATLANATPLQLDMTDNNEEHKALLKHFGIFGPPTILFFDPNGEEHKQYRLIGNMAPQAFNEHLAKIPGIGQ